MTQSIQTPEQQKWLTKLIGYSYEIHYTPGKGNVVADALSRVTTEADPPLFAAITTPSCSIISKLQQFFTKHPEGQKLMDKLATNQPMQQHFCVKSDMLYFKDKIFVPKASDLIPSLLDEFHSTPMGGHSGIKATLSRISAVFYWPGMHADVKQFVNQCSVCQYNKYSTHSPYGLLQPLPIPNQV